MAIADERIKEIRNKEGITLYPGMAGISREKIKEIGVPLLSVDIMVTQKCNFKCSYCYANGSPTALHEFTMREAIDIAQQCYDLGVRIINIQGGEPLFWNPTDWKLGPGGAFFAFVRKIRKIYGDSPLDLVAFTNVSLITKEKAKNLYRLGVGLCCKLDSLDTSVQDSLLSCTGSHLMMRGFDNLILAGYGKPGSPTISTNSVVNVKSYAGIPDVFRWARKHGFKPFIIPVHVHGREQENPDEGLSSKSETTLTQLHIKNLFERLAKIDGEEFGIYWKAESPWIENKACARHLCGVHVRADGIVVPCSEAPDYWALGDIRQKTLKEIISEPKVQKFRQIYSNLHGKCSKDNCLLSLQGLCYGCRTRAYDDSGFKGNMYDRKWLEPDEFFGSDPACWRTGVIEEDIETEKKNYLHLDGKDPSENYRFTNEETGGMFIKKKGKKNFEVMEQGNYGATRK